MRTSDRMFRCNNVQLSELHILPAFPSHAMPSMDLALPERTMSCAEHALTISGSTPFPMHARSGHERNTRTILFHRSNGAHRRSAMLDPGLSFFPKHGEGF